MRALNSEMLEKAWRFDIQHGPDGEANYAWVYNGKDLVATMRTHHAESVVEAMNRRTLQPVDGLEVVEELNRIIAEEAADFADAAGYAIEAGERPDLWDREVGVAVHTLSQASSVIAGLRAEVADLRDEWQAEYDTRLAANTARRAAEARISSLEEENKRLREALGNAERSFNNIRGAIESNQVVDKDAHGTAIRARDASRQALGDHNG